MTTEVKVTKEKLDEVSSLTPEQLAERAEVSEKAFEDSVELVAQTMVDNKSYTSARDALSELQRFNSGRKTKHRLTKKKSTHASRKLTRLAQKKSRKANR